MESTETQSETYHNYTQLGLEAFRLDPAPVRSPSANMLAPSSSLAGDYIGVESCLDLQNDGVLYESKGDGKETAAMSQGLTGRGKREQRWEAKRKQKEEFPPPIPLLARTENLPSHMPWVLKRHYTSDGRLILREEKVRHHEYFRAHRSNGRLTLHLIPLDDDILSPPLVDDDVEEEEEIEGANEEGDGDVSGDDEEELDAGDNCREEESVVKEFSDVKVSAVAETTQSLEIGGSGIGKCMNYISSVRTTSPCFLGMTVPAIRPVHT